MTRASISRLLTTALALALVAGSCSVLPGGGGGGTGATVFFERAVSLFEGSEVRVLGLPAGTVDEVEVEGDRVRVEITVDDDVPVPADVQATIVPLSLIGERYVQLFPAYTGGPRLDDGAVIPLERTTVPVEPDEALRAVRDLLDDLNPEGSRRLTENLAEDLDGQGETINDTIREIADVTRDFGAKSEELGRIIDNFDDFTRTLLTREDQIGEVLDDFAVVTGALAEERDRLGNIVTNLATFAGNAKDLVDEHGAALGADLEVLEHVAQAIRANIDSVDQLLAAGPITGSGLKEAVKTDKRVVDLRDSGLFEQGEGGEPLTLSGAPVDSDERAPPDGGAEEDVPEPPVPESPFGPLDDLLRELTDTGAGPLDVASTYERRSRDTDDGGFAAGVLDVFGGFGGFARAVTGVV